MTPEAIKFIEQRVRQLEASRGRNAHLDKKRDELKEKLEELKNPNGN